MLGRLPNTPRPLKQVKANKRKDYLKLAEVLLARQPNEVTRRSVEFLARTCDEGHEPDPVPPLPWLDTSVPVARNPGMPKLVGRIAPAMRFHADHDITQ